MKLERSQRMKRIIVAVIASALGAAVALTAVAQGRHDEKPHGLSKPATEQSEASGPSTGGRHDERPHGMKKKAAPKKKTAPKKTEGNAGTSATESSK